MKGTDRGRILSVLQLPLAIVRTVDGVEHLLFHFTKDVLVHGRQGHITTRFDNGRPKVFELTQHAASGVGKDIDRVISRSERTES